MNKPAQPPLPDDLIGPLDEHGQQIWSLEEAAAIARVSADAAAQAGLARAENDIVAGRVYTDEQVRESMVEMKRRWFAAKGITPPPGYFDR